MGRFSRHETIHPGPDAPLKPEVLGHDPADPSMKMLEFLAWLMDRSIKIPGTNVTVGLDAILGLLPVGGDVATGLIQAGIVLLALTKYRVPKSVAVKMAGNVLLDTALGSIPILGDFFDAAFKANTRNLQLLQQVRQQPAPPPVRGQGHSQATSYAIIGAIAAAFIVLLGLVLVGFVTVIAWLLKHPVF